MGCLADTVGTTLACGPLTGRIGLAELGVTERELTDFMGADHATPEAFLIERIAMAERVVTNDMLGRYQRRIRVHTFLDRGRIGDFGDLQEVQTAPAATDNGMVIETLAPNSNLKIEISRIEVYTPVAGEVNIRFYDLMDGFLLHTQAVTAVADTVTAWEGSIQLVARRRHMRILVVHDLPSYYRSTIAGDCATCPGKSDTFRNGLVRAWGAFIATASTKKLSNVERRPYTSGLAVVATVVCDHAAWLCEIKDQLTLPMGYKVCEEIQSFGYNNVDRFTNRNFSEERLKQVQERANFYANKYAAAMDALFSRMPLPTDEVCFDCNRSSRHAIAVP